MNFKAKGNALVSVLACNVLMAAFVNEDNWPDNYVKVMVQCCLLFVCILLLKPWSFSQAGWECRVWNHFPTPVHTVIHVLHSGSYTLISGVSVIEFIMSWRSMQLKVILTWNSRTRNMLFSPNILARNRIPVRYQYPVIRALISLMVKYLFGSDCAHMLRFPPDCQGKLLVFLFHFFPPLFLCLITLVLFFLHIVFMFLWLLAFV